MSAGQGYFPGPGAVRLQPPAARPFEPSPKGGGFRAVSAPAAIRKAAVMACHGEGGRRGWPGAPTFKSAGSGVIHPPGIARQPPAKRSRVFSNVMGRPGQQPCASPPKGRENSAARCSKTVCSRPSSAMCARNLFSIAVPFLAARARAPCGGPRMGEQNMWLNRIACICCYFQYVLVLLN